MLTSLIMFAALLTPQPAPCDCACCAPNGACCETRACDCPECVDCPFCQDGECSCDCCNP